MIKLPESGLHICEYPGECVFYNRNVWQEINGFLPHYNNIDVLKFDNSHDVIHSKEVIYSVKMIPSESELSETTSPETEATPTQAAGVSLAGSIRGRCTLFESQGQCFQSSTTSSWSILV